MNIEEKATHADYNEMDSDYTFSRIVVTVSIKAGQILKARIRAKWCLIDWGDGVLNEEKEYQFNEGGTRNINIVGNRINWLNVDGWNVTGIYLDRCPFLTRLRCQGNKLQVLNLVNCPALVYVDCSHNQIDCIQVAGLKKLKEVKANHNDLKVVDFSGCLQLKEADLNDNNIFIVITQGCRKLESFWFNYAEFKTEDYKKAANDFPGVIINERGVLTVRGDKELIESGERIIEEIKRGHKS